MATIDLRDLSLNELKKLQKDLTKVIDGFPARQRQEALAAVHERAKDFGLRLGDLTGGTPKPPRRASVAKYRHPENPSQTWSSCRRQPDWMKNALAAGKSKDEFLIHQ